MTDLYRGEFFVGIALLFSPSLLLAVRRVRCRVLHGSYRDRVSNSEAFCTRCCVTRPVPPPDWRKARAQLRLITGGLGQEIRREHEMREARAGR